MTGVLARLVARARGEAAGGIRPRLPARFEGPAGPLEQGDAETPAARGPESAAPVRDRARVRGEQAEGPPHSLEPPPNPPAGPEAPRTGDEIHRSGHEPRHARDPGRDRAALAPERPGTEDRGPKHPSAPGRPESETPAPVAPRAAPQDLRAAEVQKGGPAEQGAPEAPAGPAPRTAPEPAPPPERPGGDAPPAPLIPVRPAPSFAPADEAPRDVAVTVRQAGETAPHAASSPEPDIVIHIGRIDLKAPAEPAPQPRPRAARSRTTGLHDYLAGRSGGR